MPSVACTPTRCASSTPRTRTMQAIVEAAPRLADYLGDESKAHFERGADLPSDAGIPTASTIAWCAAWTTTTSPCSSGSLGALTICAGGRCRRLFEMLGGKPAPAAASRWAASSACSLLWRPAVLDAERQYPTLRGDVGEGVLPAALAAERTETLPGRRHHCEKKAAADASSSAPTRRDVWKCRRETRSRPGGDRESGKPTVASGARRSSNDASARSRAPSSTRWSATTTSSKCRTAAPDLFGGAATKRPGRWRSTISRKSREQIRDAQRRSGTSTATSSSPSRYGGGARLGGSAGLELIQNLQCRRRPVCYALRKAIGRTGRRRPAGRPVA